MPIFFTSRCYVQDRSRIFVATDFRNFSLVRLDIHATRVSIEQLVDPMKIFFCLIDGRLPEIIDQVCNITPNRKSCWRFQPIVPCCRNIEHVTAARKGYREGLPIFPAFCIAEWRIAEVFDFVRFAVFPFISQKIPRLIPCVRFASSRSCSRYASCRWPSKVWLRSGRSGLSRGSYSYGRARSGCS